MAGFMLLCEIRARQRIRREIIFPARGGRGFVLIARPPGFAALRLTVCVPAEALCKGPRLALGLLCPQGALTEQGPVPTPATWRGANFVLGGHGFLGATRPPNKRFLGGLRERILHKLSAIALASLDREAFLEMILEKAAAGIWGNKLLRRCIACALIRLHCRDAAGGGI